MENPIINNLISSSWESERNKLAKDLDDLAERAERINVGLGKKGSGNNAAAVKEMMDIQKQYAESLKKIAQLEEQLLNLRKTSKQLTIQEKVEKQSLNMVSKLEEQATNQNIDALTRLNAQHKLAAVNYANLSQKVGVTTKELDAAKNKMVETTAALIKLNTGTVGVKSGMNNAYNSTFQMTQVMRELPNFAIDARIGFMSLSNNLPMLYDGFKQLATQIDSVTGKQKGWGYAWKTMGASLLSMNTAMIVGVTLLTLYGDKIVDFVGKLFKGEKQAGSFAAQMDAVNKVMKDGTVKSQLSNFEELGVILNKAKEGTYDAKSAVEKYNETLGDQYGKVEDVNSALIGYKRYGQDYVNSTISMAAATTVLTDSADAFIKKYKAQQELKQLPNLASLNEQYDKLIAIARKEPKGFERLHAILSDIGGLKSAPAIDDMTRALYDLSKMDNGEKFIKQMKLMQNASIQINNSQKTASALMSKVSLYFTQGLNHNRDTVVQTAKDVYVKTKFYDEARIATVKALSEAENKIGQESADGTYNSFEEREKAAQAYYYLSKALAKSDMDEKVFNAKQEFEKTKSDIEKAKAENKKKLTAKKITDAEYKKSGYELNKDLKNAQDNFNKEKNDAQDGYDKEALKAQEKVIGDMAKISNDQYKEQIKHLKISNEEKKRLIDQNLEETKLSIEKSGLAGAFAKAFGFESNDDWKTLQATQLAEMQKLQADSDTIQLKLVNAKGQEKIDLETEYAALSNEISDTSTKHKLQNAEYLAKKEKELYSEMGQAAKELLGEGISAYFTIVEEGIKKEKKEYETTKDDELEALQTQLDAGIISQDDYNKEKAAKEDYYASVQDELDRKQFESQKRQKEAQIAMDLATGIVAAISKYGYGAVPLITLLTATAGIQVAAIEAQAFAEGGKIPHVGDGLITENSNIARRSNGDSLLAYLTPKTETVITHDQMLALGGAWAMKQAGVPGYEDARYQPDMTDIRAGYNGKTGKIIVNANFESEKIVRKLDDIYKVLGKGEKNSLMDTLKMQRYAKR